MLKQTIGEKYLRFPSFKQKAVTFSYDDGVIYDKTLIEKMVRYGFKGTFNLNSGMIGTGKNKRLDWDEALKLYLDNQMEVAIHGENHYFPNAIAPSVAMKEFYSDRACLEEKTGGIVRGMAYAHGRFNDDVISILKLLGVVYGRTVYSTHSFDLPTDWLKWNPTCHHTDPELNNILSRFLSAEPNWSYLKNPLLLYVWGHSYEFNNDNNWELFDKIGETIGGRDDVYYATNIEIYEYVKAYESLIFSADCSIIKNPTDKDVYMLLGGREILVKANETIKI